MVKAATLKETVVRLKKQLAEQHDKLDPAKIRTLKKTLKRAQRRHRTRLVAESRIKQKTAKSEEKSEGQPATT